VGGDYYSLGENVRAGEYITKAFPVARTCQRTGKTGIAGIYYWTVNGELDKAARTYQEEIEIYPRTAKDTACWA